MESSAFVSSNALFLGLMFLVFLGFGIGIIVKLFQPQFGQQNQLMAALDNTALVIWANKVGKIAKVNQRFCQISGFDESAYIGQDLHFLKTVNSPDKFDTKIWSQIESGQPWSGNLEFPTKDGNTIIMRSTITPILSAAGHIKTFILVGLDIGELATQNHQLIEAQKISNTGSWSYEIKHQKLYWSSQMYKIFEIPEPQDPNLLFQIYMDHVYVGDIGKVEEAMAHAIQSGQSFVCDHQITMHAGSHTKFLRLIGNVKLDIDGNPVSILGSCQDRTTEVLNDKLKSLTLEIDKTLIKTRESGFQQNVINELLQTICSIFNWEYSTYWIYNRKSSCLEPGTAYAHNKQYEDFKKVSLNMTFELGQGLPGLAAKARSIQYFPYIPLEENFPRKFIFPKKVFGSGIAIPIVAQNEILGVIEFISSQFIELNQALLEVFNSLSLRFAEVILLNAERSKSILQAKMASVGEMSAGIAHEINNPLAIVMSNIEAIKRNKLNAEQTQVSLENSLKACMRIDRIVKGLKKYSHHSNSPSYKVENLKALIHEVLVFIETKLSINSISLELNLSENILVKCDSIGIEQVLINLLNNSVYAAKSSNEKWIKINTFIHHNDAVIQVIDPGPGIAPEIEKKLFQPFFTTKPPGEGVGLGLSISREIIQNHKGTLQVNQSVSTTCFEIRLPIHYATQKGNNHAA